MFKIIETREDGEVVDHGTCHADDVKGRLYNLKRRVSVVGVLTAVEIKEGPTVEEEAPAEEPVESDHVALLVDEADPSNGGYITFAEAAELLGVRYQQVFQKAVVHGKLRWQQTTANFVSLSDVQKWAQERFERKAKTGA